MGTLLLSCVPKARWPSDCEQEALGYQHFLRPQELVSLPVAV